MNFKKSGMFEPDFHAYVRSVCGNISKFVSDLSQADFNAL